MAMLCINYSARTFWLLQASSVLTIHKNYSLPYDKITCLNVLSPHHRNIKTARTTIGILDPPPSCEKHSHSTQRRDALSTGNPLEPAVCLHRDCESGYGWKKINGIQVSIEAIFSNIGNTTRSNQTTPYPSCVSSYCFLSSASFLVVLRSFKRQTSEDKQSIICDSNDVRVFIKTMRSYNKTSSSLRPSYTACIWVVCK